MLIKGNFMSDNTPNPYESSVLAVNNESASGSNHALIDSLDVSESWKRKFHVMDDLNSITDPKEKKAYFKSLTWGERFGQSNILAFLFGFIYFFVKGMWKPGLTFLGISVVLLIVLVVLNIENDSILRAIGIGYSVVAMTRANILYYSKKVLGKELWI